jgi:hypothetical protein
MEHERGFLAHGVGAPINPMEEFTTPNPETGADAPRDAPDDDRFEPLWNAMNHNNAEHVAGELQNAAGDLMLFALNGHNAHADAFANDTGAAVKATRAAIALCRAALDEIEGRVAEITLEQRNYHRRELEALEKALAA